MAVVGFVELQLFDGLFKSKYVEMINLQVIGVKFYLRPSKYQFENL